MPSPVGYVEKAMRGRVEAKSYRMRKVLTLSSGYNTTTTYEVVNPDRMHMSTETTVPGRGTGKREVIYIGNESYAKAGDAPWQKGPTGMGDMLAQLKDPKLAEALAQKTEVKYLGADTLDGAPMLVYQYTIKDLLGPGKDAVSKMWIGATDGLQHQTESESDVESTFTAGKITHTKTIVTYYDFNADINIAPPI